MEHTEESALPLTSTVNVMEIFSKILNVEKENFKMTPSEFIKEMSLTTEERHEKSVRIANTAKSNSNFPPQFKIVPNCLIFQRFEPRSTKSLILAVKNQAKNLLPVKMNCPNSVYFSANFAGAAVNRLAPGLSIEYEITFTPSEAKDYFHHIVITSKELKFEVPIIAIGPRPLLDIPDHIVLNPSPVKMTTSKIIVVRNVGDAPAVFNFITQRNHFQVKPAKGILGVQNSMMLEVLFESAKVKEVTEPLYLVLETGEKLHINLHGSAENICVRLDKNSVIHEDTFLGLKRCKSVRLINSSSNTIKFSWKKNKSQKEDSDIIESMKNKYEELTELEKLKYAKVTYYGLSNAEKHKISCERILNDELKLLEKEEFNFGHEAFEIIPQSGEVWPKGSVEIFVFFEPRISGLISAEAYLEVSGKDSRLPLRIKGTGMGPKIVFNLKTLDIDYAYLRSLHRYEITAENKGDIPGTIEYSVEPLVFGGKVEVTPESRYLKPTDLGSFIISFSSSRCGHFAETLKFIIKESGEQVCLVLKGKILNPPLHFSTKKIDFGVVPLGFPKRQEVTLNNLSMVPVNFFLRVIPDGRSPSISYEKFAKFTTKPSLPLSPKEFVINPEESFVEPYSFKKIIVTLISNRIGTFQKQLVVNTLSRENEGVSCPIHYEVQVANFVMNPEKILIPFCFLNFPYTRKVALKNLSNTPGFFYIAPPDLSAESLITYSANIPQGVLNPKCSITIDVTIISNALGEHETSINMLTFGLNNPHKICTITCIGQGPIVAVSPNSLHWGEILLLERVEKTLDIINESPIPAFATISPTKKNLLWSVSPSDVNLAANEKVTATISLMLNDRGKFQDTLKVNISHGHDLKIPLSAIGVGSSMKITPPISPEYDLGTLFSNKKYTFDLLLENKGIKIHNLVWSPFPEFVTFASAKFVMPQDLAFKIEPTKIDVFPGESKRVTLEVVSTFTGHASQQFFCFASIGGPAKELHLTSTVKAEFVKPVIVFDKNEINFWLNIGFEETDQKLQDVVCIKNMSVLPVCTELSTTHPFILETALGESTSVDMILDGLENKEITVKFKAEPNAKKYSKDYTRNLSAKVKECSKSFLVTLKGGVNFPNVLVQPDIIDFGYVLTGTSSCFNVNLVNTSPLTVNYSIHWNAETPQLVEPIQKAVPPDSGISNCVNSSENGSNEPELEGECIGEAEKGEEELLTPGNLASLVQSNNPPLTKPVPRMPEVQISSSDIKKVLFPLTRNYYNCVDEVIEAYEMVRSSDIDNKETKPSYTSLFDITPFYGKLEPYCSQVLNVYFFSNTPISASVEAIINIKSGPTETIKIQAISSEIDFQLSKTELDFGKQLFCETESQVLKIQNTGAMPFFYEANTLSDCEINETFPLGKGALTVSPTSGILNSFEHVELIARYHPGVPGKFESIFYLQIGYLDTIVIKVKGFGVFPQVYVSLPRPDILNIDPEIGYTAVASITPDWVLTKFASKTGMYDLQLLNPYRSRENSLGILSDDGKSEDKWETGNYFSVVPTEIDNYLAIERILAYNLIGKDSSSSATFSIYARTIPHFCVPAYELDFGVCVVNRSVEQEVTITNFGPLPVIMYGIFDNSLKEMGISVRLKNRNELKIGGCLPFIVAFRPKGSKFRSKHKKLETVLYFEIYHGPKVPIRIIAEVTYPYIRPSMNVIHFYEVICGCCKVIKLRLKNPGLVPAHWNMVVKRSKIPNDQTDGSHEDIRAKKFMFHLDHNSGILEPGEYCTVQVSFKPEFGGTFSSVLYVNVAHSLSNTRIILMGSGVEPKLNFSKKELKFKASLPFPNNVEKIFSVDNPCTFPIEFYFPEFDEQIHEEEKIIRALTLYYQTNEVLLPVRCPGDGLPAEVVGFYNKLLDGLNEKYVEEEREKILAEREKDNPEESASFVISTEDDTLMGSSQASFLDKKKKKGKKLSRSGTSLETSRDFANGIINGKDLFVPTIYEKKTPEEIEEMLEEYIMSFWSKIPALDPVTAALNNYLPPVETEEYRQGTLIIFHGAPHTNFIQLANRVSVLINIWVMNIDRIVLEEATLGRCKAGLLAKDLIEQAYLEYVEPETKEEGEESETQNSEEPDFEKDFEEIQRKFNALVDLRDNLVSERGRNGIPGSAKSETSTKKLQNTKPQMSLNTPIAHISEETVIDILRYRLALEVGEGLIIEGLQSVLISSPTKALTSLLKAVGNIKDIIVVFFLNNYAQYNKFLADSQEEQELAESYLREELLNILEEDPEEVFESLNLNEEDAKILRKLFISRRHESLLEFEKKKEDYYRKIRLKKQASKQVVLEPVKAQFDKVSVADKKEKENVKKKEASKNTKTSEVSNRKSESGAKSVRSKKDFIEAEFLSFEMDFIEMKAIIDNWDQRLGAVVVDTLPEVKSKKGQTPRKVDSAILNRAKTNRGVFLWLVDVSNPYKNSFSAFCHYLKTTLQGRRRPVESDDWPLVSINGVIFSVVSAPPKRSKPLPQHTFTISETENVLMTREDFCEDSGEYGLMPSSGMGKLNRSLSSINFKSKRKGSATSRRRRTEFTMSTEMKSLKLKKRISSFGLEENQLKPRWILQPGEMMSYRVRYFPVQTDEFRHEYVLKVVNWYQNNTVICTGKCDIPRIDMKPEVLFPAVEYNKTSSSVSVPAYYYAEGAYNFGPIIIPQTNDKKPVRRSATFSFFNKSVLPVDLCVILAEDKMTDESPGSDHFKFKPQNFYIRPREAKSLTVTAIPTRLGKISETLLLVIKDNPKVESIKVIFEGVKASVLVEPKLVNFDRLLLHRKETRQVVFTNENVNPLFFCFQGIEEFPCQFTFSHTNGCISPLGSFKVDISYNATEAQLISEKPLLVQIFDDADSREPVQEFSFFISAEAYDVALDISFANVEDDHIDFGDIRVENIYTIEFNLKNVGKYQLGYKIDIDKMFSNEAENQQFYLIPQEGKLPPGKRFPVTVTFIALNEVSWKREPLFRILLVEPYRSDELIATIPIGVSARSHFSRYELLPSEQFNFGHIQVGSLTTGSLLIENKGHFSFSYNIDHISTAQMESKSVENLKKHSKRSSSSKEKGEKGKKLTSTSLKAGAFEISPSSGVAEAGQATVVSISCCLNEVKSCEEKIVIFVSECLPHLKKGNEVTVSAEGCLPVLRFKDYKSIFKEHFVCKDEAELSSRTKPGSYTFYSENNNLFSFKNVCVNKTAEARIHLPNGGLIECTVTALIASAQEKEESRTSLHSQGSQCFAVSPEKLIIEPYSSGCLLLTFQPDALEVYKARLIISLKMPDTFQDEVRVFDLCGNGILPQIEITKPSAKLPEGQALVGFPPVSPGHTCSSSIAFCNTGVLDCKVILELYKTEIGVFSLVPKPGTEKMLRIWELIKPIDHTAVVSMSPGEVAEFEVTFNPQEVKSYSSQLKLFVVDNPFENWSYLLSGEVFFEEVVIEKIRTSIPFLTESGTDEKYSAAAVAPGQYFINFADCYVKKKSKVLLRLSNKTEKEYFKFEWDEVPSITVSPSVGHLYPNTYKEILLVFYPEEPMDLEDVTISCLLNKILIDCPPEPSWDSRLMQHQKQTKENTNMSPHRSFNESFEAPSPVCEEPEHQVVPESNKMLYINVSGIADYAKLTCQNTQIIFKNTFMFQTRVYPLVLENSGNITLEYKLILKSVTVGPLKEDKMSQVSEKFNLPKSKSRPQSSVELSSFRKSRQSIVASKCKKYPRPLTSVSVLDLKNSFSARDATEQPPKQVNEEQISYNPFAIENSSGCIQPKEKVSCNVTFSPMDINEYKAKISVLVANLHPECNLPEIEVTASSIMPYCHFDIPESDYLESGRRDHSRPGPIGYAPGVPLHPDTKAIEIKVLGIGMTVPIKFHVINPTEEDYTFSWTNATHIQPGTVGSFHCSTVDGCIRAGRQQLMAFSFVSQKIGITESFWIFNIPKHGIETPFLFVADVRKPAIYFLSSHVNLKPTIVGSSSSESLTLVNHEEKPFEFYFVPESLYSEGRFNFLKVEPPAGKILENSELSFRLTFTGKTPGKTHFSIKCKVKSIKEPFTISVEVVTYVVQPLIAFEDLKKVKHYFDVHQENVIDFGSELRPNIPETITMTFTSLSKTSFYYEWEYNQKTLEVRHCKLKFSMKSGHVVSFSRVKCDVTIVFYKKSSLICFPATLMIKRGPTFNVLINGSASTPLCDMSFNSFDFGYCFLQEKDICFYETVLVIKNKNATDLLLECALPETSAFSYILPEAVIPPGKEMTVPIEFHPKECISYNDVMKFTINGNHEKIINLKGHGTDFKVTLADAEDTTISLGAVKVGKTSSHKFSLVNRSLAPVTLLVGFSDQFPVSGLCLAKPKENPMDLSQNHRLTGVITITPSTVFSIKPQDTVTLVVTYTPHHRTPSFSETVCLQHQEKVEPLCIVKGCCLGPDISLDRYFLNFGAVVKSCRSTLKLKLVNSGSVGARFEWRTERLSEYSLSPICGYISPESDVTIHVTFCPSTIQNCIKNSVECKLYLSEDETYPSRWLELIGNCVSLPEPTEILTFECLVRQTNSKSVKIENTSGSEWQLIPIISGEYFKGFDAVVIPPLSSALYQVDYCPLVMTTEKEPHQGALFFKLPNGKALMYRLKGTSLPPNPEDTIERNVPCKTKYTELLKVKNWLQYPQRFKVSISCVENYDDPACSCSGFDYLEVPALAQKDYSLNFFAYNTGYLRFHVTFVNEETKEYTWYDIRFNVFMCGPLEVITLKSRVRQTCEHEIKLKNPTKQSIEYTIESTSPDIHTDRPVYEVPPEKCVYATISFRPIHPGEKNEKLMATCPELGVFPRELRLIALEGLPEPPRVFEAPLGTSNSQGFDIRNFSNINAVLNCRADSEDFIVNEEGSVAANQTAQIKVTFEPSEIGSTTATLFVDSQQAGNFVFPLQGICTKPLAKGPFSLISGSGVIIPFKNVFRKAVEFHMYVDNPAFALKTAQETLLPKEESKIFVGLQKVKALERLSEYKESEINPKFPVMGQLVVECFNPYVKWQFYLKGILEK